jgi:catechol 2,3-dioxygenase-like lactoylglutathione lyase family enzyme
LSNESSLSSGGVTADNIMTNPTTKGLHHIGLTVSRLEESAAFFTSLLGWQEVRRDEAYPAIFVSDGTVMVTLWKNREEPPAPFDKDRNVGLHHVAFVVETENELIGMHEKLVAHGIDIEFGPELLRQGPARHMMCYEPSGVRVEIIWPGS